MKTREQYIALARESGYVNPEETQLILYEAAFRNSYEYEFMRTYIEKIDHVFINKKEKLMGLPSKNRLTTFTIKKEKML